MPCVLFVVWLVAESKGELLRVCSIFSAAH